MASLQPTSPEEQVLIDLAHWLARVLQYGAEHPACRALGEKAYTSLTLALTISSPLAYGVLKEEIVVGETRFAHPVIRTKLAPHLHERGILLLRFSSGVTTREVWEFVELLTASPQSTYDRGGLLRLLLSRGIARVDIEELEHDVTAEEREAQRLRNHLRDFFADMLRNLLAARTMDTSISEQLRQLLSHPHIAVTLLEEDPVGLAEATAGLALMVKQEEARSHDSLAPKLRDIILALTPPSRARVLLGLPALSGEFRSSLLWAFDGFSEEELARFALPALRARPTEVDIVLYALAAASPRDLRRRVTLRRAALSLFDLPSDDPSTELLSTLAAPILEHQSFAEDHQTLRRQAVRALAVRSFPSGDVPLRSGRESLRPSSNPSTFSGRGTVRQAIRAAARIGALERVCRTLSAASQTLAERGERDALAGIVLGLNEVVPSDPKGVAAAAIQAIAKTGVTAALLETLDQSASTVNTEELDDLMAAAKILIAHSPQTALDRLDVSDSRKVRRLLLDGLATASSDLRPLLLGRLKSSSWFVVRNAVVLLARGGGKGGDLLPIAGHPNEKVRLEIARALRLIAADVSSMDIAAGYLGDPSQDVRDAASLVLRGEPLGMRAITQLEAVANDESQPDAVRERVLRALGESANDEAAKALFGALSPRGLLDRGSAAHLREVAASALYRSTAPLAAALFAEGLGSSTGRIRKACERASATRST